MTGQSQKGGAGAVQYQVAGDLVVVEGVTEERALEIARASAKEAIETFSAESHTIADKRISELDVRVVKALSSSGLLGSLADPAVQVTLRKAQMGAASSDRKADYDILSALIDDRVKRADERPVRASVNRAVEVVDQLDDTALAGLTVMQAATQFRPLSARADDGIQVMESLFSQLLSGVELPHGSDWLDHLDVLGAIRVDGVQKFLPFDQFWASKTPGYVSPGVEEDSEEANAARQELAALRVVVGLEEHQFKAGYLRAPFPFKDAVIEGISTAGGHSPAEIEEISRIFTEKLLVDQVDPALVPAYMERVRQHECHRRIAEWWETIDTHFAITSVGRVLARANSKRLDKLGLLPPLH